MGHSFRSVHPPGEELAGDGVEERRRVERLRRCHRAAAAHPQRRFDQQDRGEPVEVAALDEGVPDLTIAACRFGEDAEARATAYFIGPTGNPAKK